MLLYVWEHIFRTSTIKISINFTLLKPAGLLFHSYYCTVAKPCSRQHLCSCSKVFTWAHTNSLPLLLLRRKLKSKKNCALEYFYSIRSFTAFLCFVVGAFFAWPGSWRSANESLMDRMEQSKRGAWPPCPFIFPLPGLFEQSVRIRTGSQALMEATHFEGALYLWCWAR